MKLAQPAPDHCFRCGESYVDDRGEGFGELCIAFWGGYGSFVDTVMDAMHVHPQLELPMPRVPEVVDDVCLTCFYKHMLVLCHDCAHALCDFLGIDKETQKSTTSHSQEYIDAHPEHFGWDYDRRNGT